MTDDKPVDLDAWTAVLAQELGIELGAVPVTELLDLTRDAAHGVTRPAGPLTTYLVGLAMAEGMSIDDAAERTRAAVRRWQG